MSNLLTTKDLSERFGVHHVTARKWCERGLFPNAKKLDSPRGQYWVVPESDLKDFKPKVRTGRPMTDTPSNHAIAKRKLRAKQKEKAV